MSRNTEARIDLAVISYNLKTVWSPVPGSQVASVVKADGYGYGITRVAGALRDSDLLAVPTSGEVAVLRKSGVTGPVPRIAG